MARSAAKDQVSIRPFRGISNGALASKDLPARLKILDWGENQTSKGKVLLDDTSLALFANNQRILGREEIALDFNHNTLEGSPAYLAEQEPRAVAAYCAPEIVKGEGLFLKVNTWTPSGEKSARDFADLSPAPFVKDGRVIGLHSCALTPTGAVYGLSFYSALEKSESIRGDILALSASTQPKDDDMKTELEELSGKLEALTNLLTPLAADVATLKSARPAALSATIDGKEVVLNVADILALRAESAATKIELETAKGNISKGEATALIVAMSAEGRCPMNPKTKVAYTLVELQALDLNTLSILALNSPVLPLHARSAMLKVTAEPNPGEGKNGLEKTQAIWDARYPSVSASQRS